MRRTGYLLYFLLTALTLCLPVGAVDDDFSPWDAWRQAYIYFQRGEQARDRGDYILAVKEFRNSLQNYTDVRQARPDWNQNVIQSRIELCKREIASARRLLGHTGTESEAPTPSPESTSTSSTYSTESSSSVSSTELSRLQAEAAQYKKRLFGALVELDDLRKQANRSKTISTELENLMRERRVLQEKYQLLETRYKQLEKKASEPNSELEASRRRLIELRINLETATRKLALADENILLHEHDIKKLHQERAELKKALESLRKEQDLATRTITELRRFRDSTIAEKNLQLKKEEEAQAAREKADKLAAERQKELETLNRRIQEITSKDGAQGTLNIEISQENQKLRQAVEKYRKELETALKDRVAIQNKLRELQLELSDVKSALQRIDDRRTQMEQDTKLLRTQLEKQLAASDLATKEMKNLRLRNQQLANDLKTWAEKYEKAKKRLDERDAAELAGVSTLNTERRKLNEALTKSKLAQTELTTQVEQLQLRHKGAEKMISELRGELLKQKTAQLSADQELKKFAAVTAERDKLAQELANSQKQQKELKQNFTAIQQQLKEHQALQRQLAEARQALAQARKQAEQSDAFRKQIAALEKRNQQLQDAAVVIRPGTSSSPTTPPTGQISLPPLNLPKTLPATAVNAGEMMKNALQAEKEDARKVAIWNYRSILESQPDHFDANLRLGLILLRDEKYDEARTYLQRAHLQQPGNLDAAVAYAKTLLGLKRYGNALEILGKTTVPTADDYQYRLTLGQASAGAGQVAEAERSFWAATKLHPSQPQPYLELARLLCGSGEARRDEAAKVYEKAKKLGATPDAVLENALGKLLNERSELIDFLASAALEAEKYGDAASAVWYYSQLRDMDPESAKFAAKLAINQIRSGQPELALQALEQRPVSPESQLARAFALFARKSYDQAAQSAEQAIKLNQGKTIKLSPEHLWLLKELDQAPVEAAPIAAKLRAATAK